MAYTARELIINAYYLSGVVSRKFQSVDGDQISDGLRLLNEALAEQGINGNTIPYFKEYSLNAVVGQEEYFIPGLIEAETFTFNIGPVRYSMEYKERYRYFGTSRADNIQSLPYEWHIERALNGANLFIYFLPNTAYPMKMWGKFKLDEIADLCDDLDLVFDKYYIKFLTYSLAEDICEEYQVAIPPAVAKKLSVLEEKVTFVSPIDLSTKKRSSFRRGASFNYGIANLGNGWMP